MLADEGAPKKLDIQRTPESESFGPSAESRGSTEHHSTEDAHILRAVESFQAGVRREESFRVVVKRFYQPVTRFFLRRSVSAEECLDLTQETFLRIYTGLGGFRHETRLSNWIFRIAWNTCSKWRERQARKMPGNRAKSGLPHPPGQPAGFEEGQAVAVSPERPQLEGVLHEERRELLREAVAELPRKMRHCVVLRLYQEMKYKEIAGRLDISIETVKAHLGQARKQLKERLQDIYEDIDLGEMDS